MYLFTYSLTSELTATLLADADSHLHPQSPQEVQAPHDAGGVQQVQQLINQVSALQIACPSLQLQLLPTITLVDCEKPLSFITKKLTIIIIFFMLGTFV